jgi:uncharacterized protein with HEPN domain
MKRLLHDYLDDMIVAIGDIEEFIKGLTFESFIDDRNAP